MKNLIIHSLYNAQNDGVKLCTYHVELIKYGYCILVHMGYSFSLTQQGFFYMHHPTDRITHTTAFVTPNGEHWLEQEKGSMGSP